MGVTVLSVKFNGTVARGKKFLSSLKCGGESNVVSNTFRRRINFEFPYQKIGKFTDLRQRKTISCLDHSRLRHFWMCGNFTAPHLGKYSI